MYFYSFIIIAQWFKLNLRFKMEDTGYNSKKNGLRNIGKGQES